eukprot:scaffold3240_cov155-Skeletonema_menzelii.AAC.3
MACTNEKVTEGIIQCLLDYFPDAVNDVDGNGLLPLHFACENSSVSLDIIQLLIDAAPDTLRSQDNYGRLPLHCCLCGNTDLLGEKKMSDILKLLLEKHPESIRHADDNGQLPLHYACHNNKVAIIELLIDAAPDSVRCGDKDGNLPLHRLCIDTDLDEMAAIQISKLLLEMHPESIRHADNNDGNLPIHIAAGRTKSSEFFRLLIEAYPGSERIAGQIGMLPFHYACIYNTVAIVAYLHERYPDAINHAIHKSLPFLEFVRSALH